MLHRRFDRRWFAAPFWEKQTAYRDPCSSSQRTDPAALPEEAIIAKGNRNKQIKSRPNSEKIFRYQITSDDIPINFDDRGTPFKKNKKNQAKRSKQ